MGTYGLFHLKDTKVGFATMEYNESNKFSQVEDEYVDLWFFLMHARDVIFRARQLELRRYGITTKQVNL
jgi:hypothetical protein